MSSWNYLFTFTIWSQKSSTLQQDQTEATPMYAVLAHETSKRLRKSWEYDVKIYLRKISPENINWIEPTGLCLIPGFDISAKFVQF
jgi:hypothetical protein